MTIEAQQKSFTKASIRVKNGPVLEGYSFGAAVNTCAELVFQTGASLI